MLEFSKIISKTPGKSKSFLVVETLSDFSKGYWGYLNAECSPLQSVKPHLIDESIIHILMASHSRLRNDHPNGFILDV